MKRIPARLAVLAAGMVLPAAVATGAIAGTGPGGSGQSAAQWNATHQQAKSKATSAQVAPSVNVPLSVLSKGSDNGPVTQAPSSSAKSGAFNANSTWQGIMQRKHAGWHASPQLARQGNATGQESNSRATSVQVAPSVNAPVSVLSKGSDNGRVTQAPSSSAKSGAGNVNLTGQGVRQAQRSGHEYPEQGHAWKAGGPAGHASPQLAWQGNATGQESNSRATSVQVAPSVNAPVSVLSKGSDNGRVTQAPSSSAKSGAGNVNMTRQGVSQGLNP